MSASLETIIAKLAEQVKHLEAQVKERQATLKAIQGEIYIARQETDMEVACVRAAADKAILELHAKAAPYKDTVRACELAQRQLHEAKTRLASDTAQLKHERHVLLAELDAKIAKKSATLANLAKEEEAFRARVLA